MQNGVPLTGLVCDDVDAVAQLIGGQLRSNGERFVSGRDAFTICEVASRLIVTSQDIFLSDLKRFQTTDKPVDLVIRRPRFGETDSDWETNLNLIKHILARERRPELRLLAVTEAAAQEIDTLLGFPVEGLALLPAVAPQTSQALVEGRIVRLPKTSGTDTMPLADVNWWRLRKTASFTCAPNSPLDVQDLVAFATPEGKPEIPKTGQSNAFLFVVSNGVGLGHLTRLLAVAKQLKGRVLFWSYSQAAQLIEEQGFPVVVRMTAEHLGASVDSWNAWEAADITAFVGENSINAIVYDGSSPPKGILDALVRPELGDTDFIWLRRGMWHQEADTYPLSKTHHCSLVIEPRDLAHAADVGPTRTITPAHLGSCKFLQVPPVVATRLDELLSRRKARSALNHWSFRPLCLLNLGGESLADHAPLLALIKRLAAKEKIRFLWLRSPFSSTSAPATGTVQQLRKFPIAPLLNAFDGIITAAGYNSFHEVLTLSRAPVLFAPNRNARLDDQYARATFAVDQGWAQMIDPEDVKSSEMQIKEFLGLVGKKTISRDALSIGDGASNIANAITDFAQGYDGDAW